MRVLAAVVANPRLKGVLGVGEGHLVSRAGDCDFDEFVQKVAEWVALADEDGAHDGHERADRDRKAHASIVGDRFYLDAAGGVVQGKMLKEVLEAFAQAEWFADWEAGVLEHGEEMYPGLMARTDQQRRFDALIAVFVTAATGMQPGPASRSVGDTDSQPGTDSEPGTDSRPDTEPETDIGAEPNAGPEPESGPAPAGRVSGRSSGAGCGVVVNLMVGYEYFMYHLRKALGHVRRVVLDSNGVVLDMGRRQRLFTGPLRDAVMMTSRWCIWPGCARPAAHCEADHLLPWGHEGPTKSGNGGPACGYHNRWKSTGHQTWHDPQGHWHHYRPDGTEIGWRTDLNTTSPIDRARNDTTHNPAA